MKIAEKRNHIAEAVRFLVNDALWSAKNDSSCIVYQNHCFVVAIKIIKKFELSRSTIDWMATKLIERYNGSFIALVIKYIDELVSLSATKSVVEQYLKELIKAGHGAHASRVAKKYLKRNLTEDEMKQLIDVMENSSSLGSTDEMDLINVAKNNGHADLEQEIKDALERKRERFDQDDY